MLPWGADKKKGRRVPAHEGGATTPRICTACYSTVKLSNAAAMLFVRSETYVPRRIVGSTLK